MNFRYISRSLEISKLIPYEIAENLDIFVALKLASNLFFAVTKGKSVRRGKGEG